MDAATERSEFDLKKRLLVGVGLVLAVVLGVGGWAGTAPLTGAVIAPGQVIVDSNLKKIQHPTGGVVGEIRVKGGDYVEAGTVLLRLDDTQTRANLGIIVSQIVELMGRRARLEAERDGAHDVVFPIGFGAISPMDVRDERHVIAGERRLFEARSRSAEGRKAQLRSRIGQLDSEIAGLKKQEKAKSRELSLVKDEINRLAILHKKQLLPATRMLAMERDATRIEGEHGALLAQIARAEGQITEIELQILEIDETIRTEAQKELRDLESRLAELNERRIAAEDMLRRVELKAPQSGVVHELAVHTVGGVIAPGDTVMSIVPKDDQKTIEVRLMPTDIDQVTIGQPAVLRFPAFNQRTTPEVNGKIARLAADVSMDPKSGISYYTARVSIAEDEIAKLGDMTLMPGMPVESLIKTSERTALSYLAKPFADHLSRTFKEE
jgi:HlyD family secretion protein